MLCKTRPKGAFSRGLIFQGEKMDALAQQLLQQLASSGLSQISKKIGIDEQTTNSALSMALPLLFSALAKNASKPEGAQALQKALANDHDGSILDDVPGLVGNPQTANGDGILNHVLGSQRPVITQGLSKSTGLDSEQIGQLLQIAAPLVMGSLGKQQKEQGFDSNGLTNFLGEQQQMAQKDSPDMLGTLNSLLDVDQDGSALDDILGMAGKLLGGR
jgi:hypothetical protein